MSAAPLLQAVRVCGCAGAVTVGGAQVHAIREREDGGSSTSTGFLARLAKKIRDNLEIHITNFRVNVVDNRSPHDGRAYR